MTSLSTLSNRVAALEARRGLAPQRLEEVAAAIRATLFDKQLSLDGDKARRKSVLGTRRCGKTDFVPKRLLRRAACAPESIRVYLAITRVRAKELIWRPLQLLAEKHKLAVDFNETLATATLPNHAVIRLRGADDKGEANKGRGDKLHEVVIDEAQIFPSDVLQTMVEDVFGPGLEDVGGDMTVLGTPGIVCAGKWFGMTRPDSAAREKGWSHHSWSVLDNPFMAHMKTRLPELKAERGWADDNPTYMREWLGRWVNDNNALFYRFDPLRNEHTLPVEHFLGGHWLHSLGWDIGLHDHMALVVWAFHPKDKTLYEAYSWKQNGITSDVVMDEVRRLEAMGFNFISKAADTGGLGALIVEEVKKRHSIRFDAAKKTDKSGHVRLFNDELLCNRVKLRRGSPYAQEIAALPKDPDWTDEKEPREDPRFANHCCDGGLYAWRGALHYLAKDDAPDAPRVGSPAWHEAQAVKMAQEAEAQIERDMAEITSAKRAREEAEDEERALLW